MELGRQAQSKSAESMSLRFAGLKPRTLRSYNKALLDYFVWLEQEAMPVPKTTRKLDDSLAEYLEHLFLDDRPIAHSVPWKGFTREFGGRYHLQSSISQIGSKSMWPGKQSLCLWKFWWRWQEWQPAAKNGGSVPSCCWGMQPFCEPQKWWTCLFGDFTGIVRQAK